MVCLIIYIMCRETTGPEIWWQTQGTVDCVIGGVGTGGTLTGIAEVIYKSTK